MMILKKLYIASNARKEQKISMLQKLKQIMTGQESQQNVLNVTQIKVNLFNLKENNVENNKIKQKIKEKYKLPIAQELHKSIRTRFPKRKVFTKGIVDWAADLVLMKNYEKENDNYSYILNVIDTFSKFVWSYP
jgi:hypothetical protein